MAPVLGDLDANVGMSVHAMRQAAAEGASFVVFPELSLTGYCFETRGEALEHAIGAGDEAFETLTDACAELDQVIAVGYLERMDQGFANVVSLIGGDGIVGHYRKTHLPHLGVDKWTEQGWDPLELYEVGELKVGLLICFDASFPEATRLLAMQGADVIVLPTNWPAEAIDKAGWLPNTRAYENVIYFASVNRVGEEGGYVFHGLSRVCGPEGGTLVDGPADEPAILIADIDPARARAKRIERRQGEYWLDRMGQRREDLYVLRPGAIADEVRPL
jgi:predicted amidohydrolase